MGEGTPAHSPQAEAHKDEGNRLFKEKAYLKAAAAYTKAIKLDPTNAVYFSNRSAAFLNLLKVQKALADAEEAIKLRPTWEKGYFRKAAVLEAQEKHEEALRAYKVAADINPNSSDVASKIRYLSKKLRTSSPPKPLKTEEEYKRAKDSLVMGNRVKNSKDRVLNFARDITSDSITAFVEQDGKLDPTVHFLPGRLDSEGKETQAQVKIEKAFDSPDTLESCLGFLRKYAEDMSTDAAVLVAPRSCIAFPQRWKPVGGGSGYSKKWTFKDATGFFIQLESREVRKIWFVVGGTEDRYHTPKEPQEIDIETFALLKPLYR